MTFTPGLLAHTPVRADKVADFEAWIRSVLLAGIDQQNLPGRWQLVRTDEQRDGSVVFLFLFEGDDLEAWDMETSLRAAYGAERAREEVARLAAMIDGEQQVWRLTPVS